MLVDRSMKRGDPEGRIPMEVPSYIPRATGSDGAGCVSASQRLDQPAGAASNESKKVGEGRVGWQGGTPVSDWRWGPGGGGAASQKGASWEGRAAEERGGNETEDKKAEAMEGIEEQRALYTRAKRREGALPDLAG
jgi:hypothetical protein